MNQSWRRWSWKLVGASLSAMGGAIAYFGDCALAQITPDGTLPNNSIVTPFGNTSRISGGTQAGSNLFHSFDVFSVPTGGEANFNNALDIQNIISRVTGESISNIDGLLRANGTANLFLLNPNGIIFGPNASLNIGGSFVGSTASSLNFADGTQFSATAPQATPLLTISVPIGLQFGGNPGGILVQGQGQRLGVATSSLTPFETKEEAIRAFSDVTEERLAALALLNSLLSRPIGLPVQPGKTLALVGGDVALEGGHLTAVGGRIELGSIAGHSLVSLNPTDKGWILGYEDVQNFNDIQLFNQASVNASGQGGGDIQIRGGRVTFTDESSILASTLGSQNGGSVSIGASQLDVANSSIVLTGTINSGKSGDITIDTNSLTVGNGAVIISGTTDQGKAGNLSVRVRDSVSVGNSSFLTTSSLGTGAGSNFYIETGRLSIQDGGKITTSTIGSGNAGTLALRATDSVEAVNNSFIITTTIASTGSGGALSIETGKLIIRDGAVITSGNSGKASGGTLTVNASESVEVSGESSLLSTETFGAETAGELTVETGELIVHDGARVTVSSKGSGNAGELNVAARSIRLDNKGAITATTTSGNGGGITLQVQDLLLLRRNSNISTTAGTEQTGGNGGNINIDTDNLVALEDSDITANAFQGRGGRVEITAQGIFGTEARVQQTPETSDITASSTGGPELSGTVEINTPDVDPSSGLATLPAVPINTEVVQACQPGGSQQQSEFVIAGRGGLPPNPGAALSTDAVMVDLITLNREVDQPSTTAVSPRPTSPTPAPIIEAQGWVTDANGNVVLVANAPTVTPHSSWLWTADCQKR